MIIVTCQYLDNNAGSAAQYNGGWSQQLYNLTEAMKFAEDSSRVFDSIQGTASLTRVYNDGIRVGQFIDGTAV